ncbi:LysR family transcriptional regulator [Mesorhizobium sp. B2-4-16]|nr:LysR family transcriptional regulator [Mesorhizobium sp. B2-4-16]TPL68520.1 LysR family transcriptional regulator [Mesorhizobium sp. B2-4-3]
MPCSRHERPARGEQSRGGSLEWDDLKFVLAVARGGSLSAAARQLETTQPTVGRRIASFQKRIGARLFRREGGSLVLTEAGLSILDRLERVETEALAIERTVAGRDAGLQGVVRVTAAEWFCVRVLAAAAANVSSQHPAITLELIGEPRQANLARREADIAFRLVEFEQQDVVQRKLGRVAFGLYAAPAYLEGRGVPDPRDGFAGHSIIAMRTEMGWVADLAWLGEMAHAADIVLRTDSREVQAQAAAAGAGLACLPRLVGDETGCLERVQMSVPRRHVWMGSHGDARHSPRVQAVSTILAAEVRKRTRDLDPADRPNANA